MSWPEPHLSYLPYLSFVEYVIALISQIVAITLLSYLALCFLFNRKRMTVDTLSKSMLVYLFYHIIFSPFGILYHGYMVIKWRPEFNNYDTNVVFWLGIFGVNYYAISPIPVLFLTLDRCLVLSRISACYNENIRKTLFLTSILVIVFCFVGSTVIFLLELPLDQDKVCHCVNFSCLILKYKTRPQQLPRLAVESLNLLFSLYFFRALSGKSSINIKNRVVKICLITEICLNIVPSYTSSLLNLITGTSSVNYLGQYVGMFSMVDVACCSVMYTKIFLKRKRKPSRKDSYHSNFIELVSGTTW